MAFEEHRLKTSYHDQEGELLTLSKHLIETEDEMRGFHEDVKLRTERLNGLLDHYKAFLGSMIASNGVFTILDDSSTS